MGLRIDGYQIPIRNTLVDAPGHFPALGHGGAQWNGPQHLHQILKQRNGQSVRANDNKALPGKPKLAGKKRVHYPLGVVGVNIGASAPDGAKAILVFKVLAAPYLAEQEGNELGDAVNGLSGGPPEGICADIPEIRRKRLGGNVGSGKIIVKGILIENGFWGHRRFPAVSRSICSIFSIQARWSNRPAALFA